MLFVWLVDIADGAVVDGDGYSNWGDEDGCNNVDSCSSSSTSPIFHYFLLFY